MKTKNQDSDQDSDHENPNKINAFAYLLLGLLLTGSFMHSSFAGHDDEATVTTSQLEGSARMNEERLHPQSPVHVLRLPTNSSDK